ncbi:MAG: hypothetical protein NWF04_07310 [Candidatus Bathyarchaeota archaeon]|nr:hypothetical protein [Candidatus Bathyarchaeota archaeon]
MFKLKDNKKDLLDSLDIEISEHEKRSKILKEESAQNKQKAKALTEEDMTDAAKRRLAVYLLCKKLRNNEEAIMADLDAARLQLLMQPDHPTSETLEKVNKLLRDSASEKDKAVKALSHLSFITQVNLEQSMTELEGYGIEENAINTEFEKLKTPQPPAKSTSTQLPEVPTTPAKPAAKQAKPRQKAKS